MPDYKRYGIAGATFATILLTGQVMQMNASTEQATVAEVQSMPLPIEISDIELTSSEDDEAVVTAALDTGAQATSAADEQTAPATSDTCQAELVARPIAAALVDLELEAPCAPNERIVIHHNGMMFAEATDSEGSLSVKVPALSETAVFIASFSNGDGAVATTAVKEITGFDRAVVQMQGQSGIGLHALEFGSDYDDAGHISAASPRTVADGASGHGGFLVSLGDATLESPLVAEVYTFPTTMTKQAGDIALNVDIEITEANCDKDIEAQTMQISQGADMLVHDLDLTMPGCDAVGDFIMLKKMLNDLKVASN